MPSPKDENAALAKKVRDVLTIHPGDDDFIDRWGHIIDEGMAALDALLARLAEAEKDAESWREVAEVYKTATVAHRRDADRLKDAAEALHADVEMAESIGICLPNRVASLRLGEVLGALRAVGEAKA